MSRLVRDLQLVDARGRKYLATDECRRFLEEASIRIRTLKRRAERWCEVPVPPELLRALELVHSHGRVGSWRPQLGIQALFG